MNQESLHPVAASSDSTRTLQERKKKDLGCKTIDRLLAGFLKVEESVRTRRWVCLNCIVPYTALTNSLIDGFFGCRASI